MKTAFHVVFTLLALNFWIPVLVYIFDPSSAIAQFASLGELLGGAPYPHTEDSMFWRVLGIANVATLGFCCVLIQVDVQRWFAVLTPLVFLKGCASFGFGVAFLFEPQPQYLAACLFDAATCAAMVVFARGALRAVQAPGAAVPVAAR